MVHKKYLILFFLSNDLYILPKWQKHKKENKKNTEHVSYNYIYLHGDVYKMFARETHNMVKA